MAKHLMAVGVILCAAFLGLAAAQEKSDDSAKQVAKSYTGKIITVDATKNEVVVKDEAGVEMRLLIVPATKITKADKTIKIEDLKVGDLITSDCEQSADACTAKTILVTVAPTK